MEHLDSTLLCFLISRMDGMPLLPQEFPGTQERSGGLLPTEYGIPLIPYLRKISVGLDRPCPQITE